MRLLVLALIFTANCVVESVCAGDGALDAASAVIDVGRRKQLLVDDAVIAAQSNLRRELGRVTKANGRQPIFTQGWFYGTVLHDEGCFKLWWRKPAGGYAYATSKDGLHFETQAELTGINFAGDYTLAVTIDPHETDSEHRYKAAYDAQGMAAGLAHSGDGIHWQPYNDGRPVTGRAADTYNQIIWDQDARTYRLFTRSDFGTAGGATEWRGTRSMVNRDIKHDPTAWQTVRSWAFDREGPQERQRRQIYALTDWIYEGIHFALMSVYEWPGDTSEGPADLHRRHERDVMNFYIATSRDGDDWDLRWVYEGCPLVPRGPDGAFDKDIILPASSIVTHNDRHWLYYAGGNERHGTEQVRYPRQHAIGLAWLRLDGFVALAADATGGTLVTKPFRLEGPAVALNIEACRGECRVEVLDEEGRPLPAYAGAAALTQCGVDGLRVSPRWEGKPDLRALVGQVIRLKIHLKDARLYSFQVLDAAP
ncbi:MAG: hypothetical protein K6T86_08080 [Pirellulales bacterium]|nr:hypothetical protein [Pirellulales bacterium]